MNVIKNQKDYLILDENLIYYAIDVLFLDSIKEFSNKLDFENIDNLLVKDVFPYMSYPYAKFELKKATFGLKNIISVSPNYKDICNNCFTTDTGLIVIFEKTLFQKLVLEFNYDKLTSTNTDFIDFKYWELFSENIKPKNIGIIIPFANSIVESGGVYQILQ
jgi:hypothetical protein